MDDDLRRAFGITEQLFAQIVAALPSVLMALTVVVLGTLTAFLARSLTRRAAARIGLDEMAERVGIARVLYALQIRGGLAAVVANFVAVVVVLLTLATSAEIVGLPGVAEGVGTVVEFLPRVVSAVVVAAFGFAAADVASRVAEGVARRREDIVSPKFLANAVYYTVLSVVLTTSVQHLGMETALINQLLTVLVAGVVFGISLAFAWASRDLLQDVLCRPYVLARLGKGSEVRVGDVRGSVVSVGVVTLGLEDAEGVVHIIPYRRLLQPEGFAELVEEKTD